ncbi:MAG TPA: c-type cytochrome, partial [Candidatus Solibacter sp.]|nr:c-type cytochrome [Candidatus Solibacter sp.]
PGEESWPTQPFPTKPPPFARLKFSVDDLNPYLDEAEKKRLRDIFLNARNEGVFTPPSANRDAIEIPGELGGSNWGGAAADPETGMLYVRAIDGPSIHRLRNTERAAVRPGAASTPEQQGYEIYMQNCLTCHGPDRTGTHKPSELGLDRFRKLVRTGQAEMPAFPESTISARDFEALTAFMENPAKVTPMSAPANTTAAPRDGPVRYYGQFGNLWHANNGLPVIGPPWSEIVAYDLNEGTIKWRIPIGAVSSLAEKGIKNTGSYRPTRNGPVVTAGGLIFMATAGDRMVHAYDKDSGKLLWEREVPSNPDGIPAVYEVGGRQFVAFYAGAGRSYAGIAWKNAEPNTQGYYVFALPK